MREASIARRSNAYQRYLQAMERGEKVSPEALREAFDAVNSRFLKAAREAGYDISQVHHWNYNVGNFADQVLDARHLVPTASRGVHEAIHRATSSNPSNIWQGPISEEHIIRIIEQSTVIR